MKPTVIILCGLPYSGKSTLAEALGSDGFAVISLDAINRDRGLGLKGEPVPGFEWQESHRLAQQRLRELLADGRDVVWDDTNYAAWIRDPIFESAVENGGEPVVVFVDTPMEEVHRRAATARLAGQQACPEQDFTRVLRDFERPCCGIRVDGTLPVGHNADPVRRALRREVLQ